MKKLSKKINKYGLYPGLISQEIVKACVYEILKAVKDNTNKSIKDLSVLDTGSGKGEYSAEIARHVKEVVAVELQEEAVKDAKTLYKDVKNIEFIASAIEDFKSNKKFDLVVSLTVFEHMPKQKEAFENIFRLLKQDGLIYLTAPNKYWPFEQHYGLPFLSWLPLPLANLYLKLTWGRNSYEDCSYSLSYQGMKKFFDQFDCEYKFILPYNPDGAYFGCSSGSGLNTKVRKLGISLIKIHPFFWNFSKGFIMIIKKK